MAGAKENLLPTFVGHIAIVSIALTAAWNRVREDGAKSADKTSMGSNAARHRSKATPQIQAEVLSTPQEQTIPLNPLIPLAKINPKTWRSETARRYNMDIEIK